MKISQKKDVSIFRQFDFSSTVKNAKLTVITGPMFSGKTKSLIQKISKYNSKNKAVLVCQPKIDSRYSQHSILSHDKDTEVEAVSIANPAEILDLFHKANIVAIDEVQFFDNSIIPVVQEVLDAGKSIIVSGLDLDYAAKPFGTMPELMSMADEIEKLNSVCTFCSGRARYSHRITDESEVVVLGEKDKYVPLCRQCYNELKEK
ncbi:thymidine kinase [Crocinitomix catalasitica]|uniref:thymidine kinase n=1 Tax=Crocinitomix catalasitica TaxID=184607 RepID=UPI0009FC7A84|nr:thymidine kinase [Crocinitomix catalasitica]